MSYVAFPSGRLPPRSRPRKKRGRLLAAASVAAIAVATIARFTAPDETPPPAAAGAERAAVGRTLALAAPRERIRHDWMLDPRPALGSEALRLGEDAPLAASLRPVSVEAAAIEPVLPPVRSEPAPQAARTARFVQTVPLPVSRPAELRARPPAETLRLAERPARTAPAARDGTAGERSFFETVFGAKPSTGPALAYAPLDSEAIEASPRRRLGPVPDPSVGSATAIYDITARTVTLPSGEVLEAHSGLGAAMDDPRYVHVRMRGATPPGTYDLTEREALFHGVRAIRLHPVGGPAAIHGRTGLLAHTYMLGASGASNGCISFKRYDRFLQAYLRGEVRRVVVVAGRGQDGFPALAGRLFGRSASAE